MKSFGLNRVFVFCGCLLWVACPADPFAHRYLTREPTVEEVVGEYELKEIYLDLIEFGLSDRIRDSTRGASIVLKGDGTAILTQFPVIEEVGTFRYEFKGLKNLKGKWKVAKLGNVSSGEDELRAIYGVRFILPRLNLSASLSGQDRVEGMIFGFSDPDEGQILGFSKGLWKEDAPLQVQ